MPLLYLAGTAWTADQVSRLPSSEDESHEYKSSRTPSDFLKDKIACAASAFWNAGGGLFVAGVGGDGVPDGGVEAAVGRQPLRDWVDQCIMPVTPQGKYWTVVVDDPSLGLATSRRILLIGFEESHLAPHMAPDGRYYVRAGAHTVRAPHFVVEALLARRGLTQPILRAVIQHKPGTVRVLQLGVIAASQAPAMDVVIQVPPLAWISGGSKPSTLHVGVVGQQAPFFFDFHVQTIGEDDRTPPFTINVVYEDLIGRRYEVAFDIDIERQLGHHLGENNPTREISKAIHAGFRDLASAVKSSQDNSVHSAVKDVGSVLKSGQSNLQSAIKDLVSAVKSMKR